MGETKTPMAELLDRVVAFRCTLCDAPQGGCDCWAQCSCGWFHEKGAACRNPVHAQAKGRR